jgi:hypothetical protein
MYRPARRRGSVYDASVIGRPSHTLPEICADLADAVLRLDGPESTRNQRAVVDRVPLADAAELSAGLRKLTPALDEVALGNGGFLATLAAGLVEMGADPLPVLGVLVDRVAAGLEAAAQFGLLADKLGEVSAPRNADEYRALRDRIVDAAPAAGLSVEEAGQITQAWFSVNDWIPSLLLPLQQKPSRLALPQRDRLTAATIAMSEHAEDAPWLLGLLRVLDDEGLVVAHRESGRVFELTMSGVGDNIQLHVLLAAALIGDDRIPGERPDPAWVAAATDGMMMPEGGVRTQFDLTDASGAPIWAEGRPADIPVVDGRRVIVLDRPSYSRAYNVGRLYPLMVPELTADRALPADEAAAWLARFS